LAETLAKVACAPPTVAVPSIYGHMLPGAHDEAAGLSDAFLARGGRRR
jgi:hypothetical protein